MALRRDWPGGVEVDRINAMDNVPFQTSRGGVRPGGKETLLQNNRDGDLIGPSQGQKTQ